MCYTRGGVGDQNTCVIVEVVLETRIHVYYSQLVLKARIFTAASDLRTRQSDSATAYSAPDQCTSAPVRLAHHVGAPCRRTMSPSNYFSRIDVGMHVGLCQSAPSKHAWRAPVQMYIFRACLNISGICEINSIMLGDLAGGLQDSTLGLEPTSIFQSIISFLLTTLQLCGQKLVGRSMLLVM